ncbi:MULTISPECIES: ParB/RepB/Spo0J family partition protein [unclassified Variovorax]|uniref:ParB/RepB/Spo0J family partition protein n=1 Tax=unclassified Variovorax TaxID=663243 RepID=UPI001BD49AE1|nr:MULTISPECIES: ParB/RepB/Spo0J family partition protein [unclassified Variovorax]
MNTIQSLDLSGLAQFKASDLLQIEPIAGPGKPMQVAIALIDFDPRQPRRNVDEASIAELASSILTHGVLEPVSLRTNHDLEGRFIVNRGERRVRAACEAGLTEMPAFLDERIDPFAQVAENLHREDMSPFDLATFIAEREREGHSRVEISRRLNKSRSFITEVAGLIEAPQEIRQAFEAGRLGADVRVLYRLAMTMKTQPERATALLAGASVITRASLDPPSREESATVNPNTSSSTVGVKASGAPSAGRTVLVVEHAGRRGSLRLKAHDHDAAEVRFGDGSRDMVKLKDLRLVCWATEE